MGTPDRLLDLAAEGKLYPSLILYGGDQNQRIALARSLGQTLLCLGDDRPCGDCNACRRIGEELFHPDYTVLIRDRTTAISIEAVRKMQEKAQVSPFESKGQVFIVAEANVLSPGAANALLKILEEPPSRSPRNFLLLCPSADALLPTIRSRSMSVYLGASTPFDEELAEELASSVVDMWGDRRRGFGLWLSNLAGILLEAGDFKDLRSQEGWCAASAVASRAALRLGSRADRASLQALAGDLLAGHRLRVRAIQPRRIIEGLASRRLHPKHADTQFGNLVDLLIGD